MSTVVKFLIITSSLVFFSSCENDRQFPFDKNIALDEAKTFLKDSKYGWEDSICYIDTIKPRFLALYSINCNNENVKVVAVFFKFLNKDAYASVEFEVRGDNQKYTVITGGTGMNTLYNAIKSSRKFIPTKDFWNCDYDG